ncbi:MAG: DNA repair protein RecO [Verrucomicrobia bacterium]|nr:DNA repair protein RecO [Verrucomicrobiota bacterium]
MDERTTGFILRTRPLTETSLIVHWLTADLGRVATVAKGARRPKSPFRGKLDLFYEADLSLVRSRRSDLHTLREVALRNPHAVLREDLQRLRQTAYAATLIEQTTETETPLPELHDLFRSFLEHLCAHPPAAATLWAFELKLLDHLGLAPGDSPPGLNPASRDALRQLAAADWPALAALRLPHTQMRDLHHFLHRFLTFHLGRVPRGRDSAVQIPACTPPAANA